MNLVRDSNGGTESFLVFRETFREMYCPCPRPFLAIFRRQLMNSPGGTLSRCQCVSQGYVYSIRLLAVFVSWFDCGLAPPTDDDERDGNGDESHCDATEDDEKQGAIIGRGFRMMMAGMGKLVDEFHSSSVLIM